MKFNLKIQSLQKFTFKHIIKTQRKRLLFFAQEISKNALSFREVFIEKKQIGLSKKQRPQRAANFFRILLKLNFLLIANQAWNQYQWNDKLALNKNALAQ